jgi:H+-transporting ATPase
MEFVPFDPRTRMTQAAIQTGGETFHVGKGSFDSMCAACRAEDRGAGGALVEALSEKGLRVIAVAKGAGRDSLQLVGLAGIADRIRDDSREAIDQIRGLGVSVKMLTGDSTHVARTIARQVGLGEAVATMVGLQEADDKAAHYTSMIENSHGIAQVYPEDKFWIVKSLQYGQHVVGMTGDGVNDAPALAQAEVGIAVKNATDIAKDCASVVLTSEGLGGILPLIKTSRCIYQRVYSWTLQMVTRKLHIAFFIVVMLFLSHSLVLSLTSTLLILFLSDFATMSMSTDNVRSSLKPDRFDVRTLFGTGTSLGVLMTVESSVFALPALSYFGIVGDMGKIYTFGFAYINFVGVFTILILRERSYFWKSRPSAFLSVTVLAEVLVVVFLSLSGVLELASLSYAAVFAILGYAVLTTFLINDPIKVYLIRRFKAAG